jgi:catechol 2,3-dioxygenase-like lactoylglutathione lyase family enzyme
VSASISFRSAVPSLPVSDERRAVAFYQDALGMRELTDGEVGPGILVRDEVELHLWVADGSARGAEAHLAGSASWRIEVTGAAHLHERCHALGVVHPNAPLRNTHWGTREFGVLDPDGNLVTLFQRNGA